MDIENIGKDPSLQDMSLDELEKLMRDPAPILEKPAEVVPDEEQVLEEAKPVAEAKPDEPPAPVDEPLVTESEILKAKLDAAEAKAQKAEREMGRHAGELGYLRERIRAIETQRVAPQDEAPYDDLEPAPVRRERPEPEDNGLSYLRNVAVQQASGEFWASHADATPLKDEITKYIANLPEAARSLLDVKDPGRLHVAVRSLLEEAHGEALAVVRASRVSELVARQADQIRGLEAKKVKAATSASGTPVPPPERVKSLDEMSVKELEAQLITLTKRA